MLEPPTNRDHSARPTAKYRRVPTVGNQSLAAAQVCRVVDSGRESDSPLITSDDLRGKGILPVPLHTAEEPKPPRRFRRTAGSPRI